MPIRMVKKGEALTAGPKVSSTVLDVIHVRFVAGVMGPFSTGPNWT